MATYKELLAQRAELEKQISEAGKAERGAAIASARELIEEFDLTSDELFGRASKSARTKVAIKYRDPATGNTWTGRGKAPKWIQDQDREKFAV